MLKSLNIMKIVQLQLYLLIWCEAAESLTDQLTDLGQNVTINCDFDVHEVYWLLLKLPDPPIIILRTFSSGDPFYYRFKHKYSVLSKHRLFINNVTNDDLGLYYCVTTDAPPKYNNGTRLHIIESTAEIQIKNHTMVCTEQNQKHWQIIVTIIICVLLIIVLIIVIIGLLKGFVLGRRRTGDKHFQNTNLQQPQVMNLEPPDLRQVQCVAADFSTPCQRFQSRQINSTYALLELPKARTLNH